MLKNERASVQGSSQGHIYSEHTHKICTQTNTVGDALQFAGAHKMSYAFNHAYAHC